MNWCSDRKLLRKWGGADKKALPPLYYYYYYRGWMRQLGKYMGELGINLSHLRTMSGEEVGGAVNRWEGEGWKREVESKTTLQLYRNKVSIGDEPLWNFSSRNKVTPVSIRDGV